MSYVTVCLCLMAAAAAGVATAMGPMITWAGGTPCLLALVKRAGSEQKSPATHSLYTPCSALE